MSYSILFSLFAVVMVFFLWGVWFFWQSSFLLSFNREVGSSFECGFDSKDYSRFSFSIRFFSMLVLFLVFDVELILMLHLPLMSEILVVKLGVLGFVFIVLLGGLVEEWRRSMLKWKS